MTEQIKSAIEHLDNLIGMIEDNQGTDYDADFRLAIRSLNAWEEVLTELEKKRDFFVSLDGEYARGMVFATSDAIDIINQHLAEIEE